VGEAVKAKNEKCLTRGVRARAKNFTPVIPQPPLRPRPQWFRLRARVRFSPFNRSGEHKATNYARKKWGKALRIERIIVLL